MQIVTVYKTSRGIFASQDEASMKKNCAKNTDPREPVQRETPIDVFAIFSNGKYFELKELQVKEQQ